jgi:hypothetical protein
MLCPCCGGDMRLGAARCVCGARFVGEPLSDPTVKVQRFGPAMTPLVLLAIVVASALIFTKFLALAAVLVVWAARRAMRLAKQDPHGYGGYRTAAATLVVTLVGGAISSGFAIAYIPRYLKNREVRGNAYTQSVIFGTSKLLDDYKQKYGSYPPDELAVKQLIAEQLPRDYWNKTISYQAYTEAIAEVTKDPRSRGGTGIKTIAINNFELRSAGPDEKLGTADDIIMRDGIFYTSEEVKKQSVVQGPVRPVKR